MVEINFVCKKCFRDKKLIDWIEEDGHISDCYWCDSISVKGLPLTSLGEEFRKIIALYEEAPSLKGDSIEYLLQEDWKIFSDQVAERYDDRLRELTLAILMAGIDQKNDVDLPDFNGGFYSRHSWLEEDWDARVESLFNDAPHNYQEEEIAEHSGPGEWQWPPPIDTLEYVFKELAENYRSGKIYYRARIHKNRNRAERFQPEELGAPPPEKTTIGRGNYKGQPVLYLASDQQTAISEVRPWKNTAVAVGNVHLLKDINVINLLNYSIPESPFFEEELFWTIWLCGLFHRLAEELSRPVMLHEQETFYKPSQHLCELIGRYGYDGIIYPSGLGPGNNIILFDPKIVNITCVSYARINDINFISDTIDDSEELYEETPYDHYNNRGGD